MSELEMQKIGVPAAYGAMVTAATEEDKITQGEGDRRAEDTALRNSKRKRNLQRKSRKGRRRETIEYYVTKTIGRKLYKQDPRM